MRARWRIAGVLVLLCFLAGVARATVTVDGIVLDGQVPDNDPRIDGRPDCVVERRADGFHLRCEICEVVCACPTPTPTATP